MKISGKLAQNRGKNIAFDFNNHKRVCSAWQVENRTFSQRRKAAFIEPN